MKRNVALYVKDILENMDRAEAFIESMTYEEFLKDVKTSYAVVRCIEIIGEAAKNVPTDMKRKYKDVPWKNIAGMRDKVSHFYFGVDFGKVWLAVKKDVPVLKPRMRQILDELKDAEGE